MGTKPRKPAIAPGPSSPPNEVELPERWSVQRKSELVLRLLRGESLDAVSRGRQVPGLLAQGARGLKTRSDPEGASSLSDHHGDLLKTFADQAIENVRIFKELEARTQEPTLLQDRMFGELELMAQGIERRFSLSRNRRP
jgi:hypothetical protein